MVRYRHLAIDKVLVEAYILKAYVEDSEALNKG